MTTAKCHACSPFINPALLTFHTFHWMLFTASWISFSVTTSLPSVSSLCPVIALTSSSVLSVAEGELQGGPGSEGPSQFASQELSRSRSFMRNVGKEPSSGFIISSVLGAILKSPSIDFSLVANQEYWTWSMRSGKPNCNWCMISGYFTFSVSSQKEHSKRPPCNVFQPPFLVQGTQITWPDWNTIRGTGWQERWTYCFLNYLAYW